MKILGTVVFVCALVLTLHGQGDWPAYAYNQSGQRYSPLTQVNTKTVKSLVPAWSMSFGGEKQRGQESQPLIHNGKMFVTASYSRIFAIDEHHAHSPQIKADKRHEEQYAFRYEAEIPRDHRKGEANSPETSPAGAATQPGRGRRAKSPLTIPWAGWKDIF